jgi:hypothetical protein
MRYVLSKGETTYGTSYGYFYTIFLGIDIKYLGSTFISGISYF